MARIELIVACGVVALLSLMKRTPSTNPRSSIRCGRPEKFASTSAHASWVAPERIAVATAA